jgi:hypothetical protein
MSPFVMGTVAHTMPIASGTPAVLPLGKHFPSCQPVFHGLILNLLFQLKDLSLLGLDLLGVGLGIDPEAP